MHIIERHKLKAGAIRYRTKLAELDGRLWNAGQAIPFADIPSTAA